MKLPLDPRDLSIDVLLLAVAVIWAANYSVAKFAIGAVDTFVFNAARFTIAAVVLGAWFAAAGARARMTRVDVRRLVQAGIVGNVVCQAAFILGLSMTTVGNAAILLATAPLWTVVINARLQRERVPPSVWTGMLLSLCGIAVIIVASGREVSVGGSGLVGDLVCLASAVLWATTTNLQRPLVGRLPPLQVATVMVAVGAAGLVVLAVPSAASMDWSRVGWAQALAIAGSGALSIGVGNVIWAQGVKRLGPAQTGNFGNLIPVLAYVIAFAAFDERPGAAQIGGAVLTIAGVLLARR